MTETNSPREHYEQLVQQFVARGATSGQMFGRPCLKIERRAFAIFRLDEMVFKLTGDAHAMALALSGARLFDPSGKNRPMKEWVHVPTEHMGQWATLSECAMGYVAQI